MGESWRHGWTDWFRLDSLDLKSVPSGPGAYVIATCRPLHRAVGEDTDGVLDIGETDGLRRRLRSFLRCARGGGEREGHKAGWRYAVLHLDRHWPLSSLHVRWAATASKDEAKEVEGRLMLAYVKKHGELPPLNYSFNWGEVEKAEWKIFDGE